VQVTELGVPPPLLMLRRLNEQIKIMGTKKQNKIQQAQTQGKDGKGSKTAKKKSGTNGGS